MPLFSSTDPHPESRSCDRGYPRERFPPDKNEALRRLARFVPRAGRDYRTYRNYDQGADQHDHVSQLSPYIRNGLISEAEVVSSVLATHSFGAAEKFLQEVFWRIYWKGYLENCPSLWTRYRKDLDELNSYTDSDPTHEKAISASTGIDCFDTWSKELQETGYLHNHARMWFASIWIFTLQLPWQLGARFFLQHLLDGDAASNTLSWRWVAGLHTKGKTYLARRSNIARYTSDRFKTATGLATQASPIEEPHPPITADCSRLSPPPKTLSQNQGLLVLDEDLRDHLPDLEDGTPVLGLYPVNTYNKHGISAKVSSFRKACLTQRLDHLGADLGCKTEFTADSTAGKILDWSRRNEVDNLFLAQPQVGPWRDLWEQIATPLKQAGLAVSCYRPWWENQLFPSATGGFFKFKKGIEPMAKCMATETASAKHAPS